MPVLLSDDMKSKIRHHLGYLEVQETQTFFLGIPAGVQQQFMVEGAFDKILPSALPRVVEYVGFLDLIEVQIVENTENIAVESLGDIKVNLKEFQGLMTRYKYWQGALANLFGITPNEYDQRFQSWTGAGGINVPVQH